MTKNKLYQGSSKTLYKSNDEAQLVMSFSDNIKVGENIIELPGKGIYNNNISAFIMSKLPAIGVNTHFIEKLNMREQSVQVLDILPVQFIVSSVASGRISKEFGIDEGFVFEHPIMDFKVKSKTLNYPITNEFQIEKFGWCNKHELRVIKRIVIRIFDFLTGLFAALGIRLVECKLEFGRAFGDYDYSLMVADEFTPESMKLWEMNTNQKLGAELIETDPVKAIDSYKMISELLKDKNN